MSLPQKVSKVTLSVPERPAWPPVAEECTFLVGYGAFPSAIYGCLGPLRCQKCLSCFFFSVVSFFCTPKLIDFKCCVF